MFGHNSETGLGLGFMSKGGGHIDVRTKLGQTMVRPISYKTHRHRVSAFPIALLNSTMQHRRRLNDLVER